MKIVVICRMSDDKVRARLLPLVEIDAVEQIYLVRRSAFEMEKVKTYSSPKILKSSLFLAELFRFFTLVYLCIKEKPDYLYAIYFVPHGVYAAIAGRIFNIPVIQELIGTDRQLVNESRFYQKLLSRAKRIGVRGSSSLRQLSNLLNLPKEKFFISTAVNAINFELFKPDGSEKIYDLVYCGRLDQNKQVGLILDVFSQLSQSMPELRMLFIGDGPEKQNLEEKAKALNLSKNVTFAGRQEYTDIPDLLNQSRIFVMASLFEGLPVAMLEALSCGLPVVVPDVGDISDVAIHGYNACIVKDTSQKAYVKTLSLLLGNQQLYEELLQGALDSREKFIVAFSLSHIKESWMNILQSTE